jgi:hypothetical protein
LFHSPAIDLFPRDEGDIEPKLPDCRDMFRRVPFKELDMDSRMFVLIDAQEIE